MALRFCSRSGIGPDLVLHKKMEGNSSDQNHQNYDDPIDRMADDFEVNYFVHKSLMVWIAGAAARSSLRPPGS